MKHKIQESLKKYLRVVATSSIDRRMYSGRYVFRRDAVRKWLWSLLLAKQDGHFHSKTFDQRSSICRLRYQWNYIDVTVTNIPILTF
jgi:hypothetical protein